MTQILVLLFACILSSNPSWSDNSKRITPFLNAEGSYNFLKNEQRSHPDLSYRAEPWGGRVSAGLVFPTTPKLNVSSEIGWGYYGKTTQDQSAGDMETTRVDGEDILIGALYRWQTMD